MTGRAPSATEALSRFAIEGRARVPALHDAPERRHQV
jgi:hypothetical protein